MTETIMDKEQLTGVKPALDLAMLDRVRGRAEVHATVGDITVENPRFVCRCRRLLRREAGASLDVILDIGRTR